jgi:hypothetical protein
MGCWTSVGRGSGLPDEPPFGPPSDGGTYFFQTGLLVGAGVNVLWGVLLGVTSNGSFVAVGLVVGEGSGDGIADVINACNDIAGEVCAGEDISCEDFDIEDGVFVG